MDEKVYKSPWGSFTRTEIGRFLCLGGTLMTIIGIYWALRSVKDPVFAALVGIERQPMAKLLSLTVMLPIVMIYSKLVDRYHKEKLFYILSSVYALIFVGSSFLLRSSTWGLGVTEPGFSNYLGWVFYVSIESFGSLLVALFWAYATTVSSEAEGKQSFPLIIFLAQLGAILGPTAVTFAPHFGIPNLVLACGLLIAVVPLVIGHYAHHYGHAPDKHRTVSAEKDSGMLAGLRVLLSSKYVLGIFAVSTLHEIVVTVMDFQMKLLASSTYPRPEDFANFMGHYGQAVNGFALLWAITGSSFIIRFLGVRFALAIYPLLVIALVTLVYLEPTLWVIFACLVVFKVLNYTLNNPTKELLYIPTSVDVRFKAKAWIDTFGSRSFKGIGSAFTNVYRQAFTELTRYGFVFSLAVIAVWLYAALSVGRSYRELSDQKAR